MKIGAVIPPTDPHRVFVDIYNELINYHDVSVLKFRTFKSPIFYFRVERFLRRQDMANFLKHNDVVYFEWASDLLAYASQFPKACGVITRLHRYEMFRWVQEINWETVDKVILLTEAMQRKFIHLFPEQSSKTVVIPWAISPTKFHLRSRLQTHNIGTLCQITPRKRIYDLILTFSKAVKDINDLKLHIGGSLDSRHTDYYDAIRYLIKKLDLERNVILDGKVDDVPYWLQKIDLFVSNSFSEGLQSALIEAMATGCYCLSHHWDGAEEILPQEHLFYTDEELYRKIVEYYKFPESHMKEKAILMRDIACNKYDLQESLLNVRNVIEEVGLLYS